MDDSTLAAVTVVVFFRVMLLLLCAETAWRYARWWRHVYRDPETQLLRDLLIGIAMVQVGFLLFTIYALIFSRVPRLGRGLSVLLVGDAFLVLGTVLHLRPAWRMSEHRVFSSVRLGIAARSVSAALVALILMLMDIE